MQRMVLVAAATLLLGGCSAPDGTTGAQAGSATPTDSTDPAIPTVAPTVVETPTLTAEPTPSRTRPPSPTPTAEADPRWVFYVDDTRAYASPWFAGRHRIMIGYGCTPAPYYDPDPRCPDGQGFHHGIDVAMPCGTPLLAGRGGVVVEPSSAGVPGPAYGAGAFRIRAGDVDVLIGHARQVFVAPGGQVAPDERIALASDDAAPDGCHLHFEVRRAGGGVSDAVDPAAYLRLR